MLIDTHAHLADEKLLGNSKDIVQHAFENGVGRTISIGCSLDEASKSIELAEKHKEIYATAGLYPHDNGSEDERVLSIDERLEQVRELAKHPKVVAIGECGLDYSVPPPSEIERPKDVQEELFRKQIQLAREVDLPVVVHSRKATQDTSRVLENEKQNGDFKAVWHCFGESLEVAEQLIDLGFLISFTATITYPTGQNVLNVVKALSLNKIMVETDAPYLVPHRERSMGVKANEPAYVRIVAEKIAEVKGISLEEVAEATSKTAERFFKLA